MAVAHSLGAVYAPNIMLWTRNKMQTSRLLNRVAEEVGRDLENKGFLSLPVSADKPVEIFKINPATGKKFRQTRVLAHVSLKCGGHCGMGKWRSNLLLHQNLVPIIFPSLPNILKHSKIDHV
jgi:hypothetical protein